MKILIAEDEQLTSLTLEQCLLAEGFNVITARDGREALKNLEQLPDLIITDIMMPFTSGLEFIGIVKSAPATKSIPIIVLSAIDEESTVMQAFRLGADDFITKPFNSIELILRVKRFLLLARHH